MGRNIERMLDPRIQYARCLYWGIVFLFCTPPWIWITLSFADQSSIKFSIQEFHIAGVESSDGSNLNQSIIYFKLNLENDYEELGIYYDNLNLTFSYTTQGDIVPLANYTIPGFRQGRDAETDREGYVVTTRGITLQEISNVSVSSNVDFRVDLATAVRFRHYIAGIKSKRLQTMAWCNVEVDRITGKKKNNNAIELQHVVIRHPSAWISFAYIIANLSTLVLVCCLVFICFGVCDRLLQG
ncbi:protein NDR1 [Daucus carota subsp. sativus]|uniref:Uncharacterized protein n=2 Tax=Daucus carota subsp. sativus TaxID=79200 RepID=A0A166FAE3_DAUCS|nr:PREDICTED: protein NDR1-like [Daucus carota subsp. sativus]